MPITNQQPSQSLNVKADEAALRGAYSNLMIVSHTKEEFVLDFLNVFPMPQQATLVSRVVMSPGHIKRMLAALQDNLKRYEASFGPVQAADAPNHEIGFKA